MHHEYHRWYSPRLGQDMALDIHGHDGKPVLVFPCQGGSHHEFADFHMLEVCREFVESGRVRFITIDSVDNQSWANMEAHPADRARRHDAYDRYIREEVVPLIRSIAGDQGILTNGCSLGAYHAANFFFRHPDVCDAAISLSGLLQLDYFIGDYMDETVYLHTPLAYLRNLQDPWYIDRYRRSRVVFACGRGAWEDLMVRDALELRRIKEEKGIPIWVDLWGEDVNHDWPWWYKMMPYFLDKVLGDEPWPG